MKERDFQSKFKTWTEENNKMLLDMPNMVYELKIEKSNSFRFDKVSEHQIESLLKASGEGGLYHKISDAPIFSGMKTRFQKPKPFDCFFLHDCVSYVVVWYYIPRQKKVMYWIDIKTFLQLKTDYAGLEKKSIKEIDLARYAEYEFNFK